MPSVTVLRCIGCGAIDTPQPCLGSCREHRLDLVGAGDHTAALSALSRAESALAERRASVALLARGGDLAALRGRARAALRPVPGPVAGLVITTWACDSCGRIEAPQPCIGVCVRPETLMVEASEHDAVLTEAETVRLELARLAPPLRQLAWSTPRAGHEAETARALQASARALLS